MQKFPKCNSLHIMSKPDWLERKRRLGLFGFPDSSAARTPVHSQVTGVTFRSRRCFDTIPIT